MKHQQRNPTQEEWDKYEQIFAPVKALTIGFRPNELCGKPFVSPQLVNPSVMIIGYNPGSKGTNAKMVWEDSQDPKDYKWANEELHNPKDKFLRLFQRCFDKAVWDELIQPNQIDLVWSNLYPFHTPNKKDLEKLLDEIRGKYPSRHPRRSCREVMALLIVQLIRPKIVVCAGKDIERELMIGFEAIGYNKEKTELPFSLAEGVSHSQIDGIHIVRFSRFRSAGFYFDHRYHNTYQEDCLRKLTSLVLNE